MSDYVLHLPELTSFELFDEQTNHTKDLLKTSDVLYELSHQANYIDNIVKKNSYEE